MPEAAAGKKPGHQNQGRIRLLLLPLLLAGCGLTGPAHEPPAMNADAVVDMGLMSFEPASIVIRAGQTVEWRNTSLITHTVTDDPKQARKPADAALPRGAAAFDSGDIKAGATWFHSFAVPGTYVYFCEHHEKEGMTATVVVKPGR